MPRTTRTYDRLTGYYSLTCLTPGCTSRVSTGPAHAATRHAVDPFTGRPVHDTFRFLGAGRGNSARCRSCERSRRANRAGRIRTTPASRNAVVTSGARRFGVELELTFPRSVGRYEIDAALGAAGLTGWRAKTDVSIQGNGWEVVSPILSGDDGHEQIRTACRVLSGLGATPNRSTGMHVHHEIRDLTAEQVKDFARTWAANQDLIDGLVAESRRLSARPYYCGRLGSSDMSAIESCSTLQDVQRLVSRIGRYKTLNLHSYGRYGTVEIRQHQGTVNAEKVSTWVKLGQAMIETAATTGRVGTRSSVRDLLGALGETLDPTAKTFLLGRALTFGAVAV